MEIPPIDVALLLQKVIDERRKEEINYHKERVAKLVQEKIELELRLFVINKTLDEINEAVKNTPFLKE